MAAAATGRVRRSIRFAQLDAQSDAGFREVSRRRERMRVSGRLEMPSFQNTQDWTGSMGVSPSGQFQVIEEPRERPKILSRKGIRRDWSRGIIWVTAAVMLIMLLAQFAAIGAGAMRVQKIENRIQAPEAKNRSLQSDLAVLDGDISVCTRAVELNLISSGGAPVIWLTAPSGANMILVETAADTPASGEADLRASAGYE